MDVVADGYGLTQDINNVLNSGDVPNLYNAEDMEAIINACRVDCQRRKVAPTKVGIMAVTRPMLRLP